MDRHLLEMDISGETFHIISQKYGYSEDALRRHKVKHLIIDLAAAKEAMEQARQAAKAAKLDAARSKIIEEVSSAATGSMAERMENVTGYLAQLREIRRSAADLLDRAVATNDLRAAGGFLKELREQIRLWAELEGKLASQPTVNILVSLQWIELRTQIMAVLDDFPEAREAVADAIHA